MRTIRPAYLVLLLAITFVTTLQGVTTQFIEAAVAVATVSEAITAGASLASTSVQGLSQGNGIRNVVIEITNHMNTSLVGASYYLDRGNAAIPPAVIRPLTREAVVFRHKFHTATGTAGVLSYRIGEYRIAIAFSVPFDYNWHDNWFGLKFVSSGSESTSSLYEELYNSKAWGNPKSEEKYRKAKENRSVIVYKDDYIVTATMSNTAQAIIKIDILEMKGGYLKNSKLF